MPARKIVHPQMGTATGKKKGWTRWTGEREKQLHVLLEKKLPTSEIVREMLINHPELTPWAITAQLQRLRASERPTIKPRRTYSSISMEPKRRFILLVLQHNNLEWAARRTGLHPQDAEKILREFGFEKIINGKDIQSAQEKLREIEKRLTQMKAILRQMNLQGKQPSQQAYAKHNYLVELRNTLQTWIAQRT